MNREPDMIAVRGFNGDYCIISPQEYSWGPFLAPHSTGLFDMPIQSNWGVGPFGSFFSSWKPQARNVVWTIHIMNPFTGERIDQDSPLWHTLFSRWKAMFSPQFESQIEYTSQDGERLLGVRTVEAPQSVSSQNFEGKDPHLLAYGSVVQTQRCELPFYVGPSEQFGWETPGSGSYWFTLPYFNPGTVDIWPEWDLDGGAKFILPDYSYGSEAYGRGQDDLGKTFPVPTLMLGENTTVMSRPDMELFLSEWETPVGNRNPGFNLDYPIAPGAGDPESGCVVRVLEAQAAGLGVLLTLPRWYAEPFSTPLIAAGKVIDPVAA
ncbi:hypothetical protein [Mycolicibacterium mucogenicum]|uniref:Uncharacterized protein n=1 Tax=Mycolicibacterium mucogenicum DSM 44124 TaxID=1226753 RepID=A0A8H2PHW3_MYCMU|nr:hypothetical protein [Mycolicibacterium mucogenicum]KAB7752876.1 hypothetical protein MMUC44124_26440 [Mycolicibacterium mucogenicum DSM 44124]QPG69082.1 hypothetical protein C1S78_027465 [Mycolicibacterium mucogenicum DSM 44124]